VGDGQGRARAVTYRVTFTAAASRQLRKLDPQARRRIQAAVELLATEPRPPAARPLTDGAGRWHVRTGDYRIIYRINDGELLVIVVAIGHRREVYRDL
jgi:mRNA interferase RelE/StbE